MAVSAGGPVVRAWDLMMGGRGLKAVSNHQKTITSLALSMSTGAEGPDVGASGGGMRLLSAGVDGLVKVYDPARDYTVVHTMRYPSPILSLAVSPEERELAVGMADGTLCVRKREVKKGEDEARAYARKAITGGGVEAFVINNMEEGAGAAGMDAAAREEAARKRSLLLSRDDVRAETVRTRRLKPYESLLRSFRYSEAIDASLGPGVPAAATFAVLTELKRRGAPDDVGGRRGAGGAADGLARGLAGRDDVGLEPVLRFLLRHAANPMWTDIVADVLEVVLGEKRSEGHGHQWYQMLTRTVLWTPPADIYSSTLGLSPLTDSLFSRLWAKLSDEVKLQRQVEGVRGGLEMLLNRSLIGR